MPQDPRVPRQDVRADGAAVIEWGHDAPARPSRLVGGLLRDRRLVPVVAGLGLVAVLASLVGEWTITTMANHESTGQLSSVRVPAGLAEVGTFGVGYLVGMLGIVSALALTLVGAAPTVRHDARVVGLVLAGGLLGMLAAMTSSLGDESRGGLPLPEDGFRVEPGRGLVMAFVGTAVLGLALYLAGRITNSSDDGGHRWRRPKPEFEPEADRVETDQAEADPGSTDPSSMDPDRTDAGERDQTGPMDLTVSPSAPFARPDQPPRPGQPPRPKDQPGW